MGLRNRRQQLRQRRAARLGLRRRPDRGVLPGLAVIARPDLQRLGVLALHERHRGVPGARGASSAPPVPLARAESAGLSRSSLALRAVVVLVVSAAVAAGVGTLISGSGPSTPAATRSIAATR